MGSFLCPRSKTAEINQEERALLDCKICRDKIKKYIKNLEKNANLKRERAKEALKNKNKDRARLSLRQAKMYTEQIKTAEGQLEMIENQIMQIETAQSQRDALSVLKQGNEVLKKLQTKKMKICISSGFGNSSNLVCVIAYQVNFKLVV